MLLFIRILIGLLGSIGMIAGALMFWKLRTPNEAGEALTPKQANAQPLISIIIPARNEAKRIRPLLESLQRQTFKQYELIVVDDESTDETSTVASSYGANVIQNKHTTPGWSGKSLACWNGALTAQGEWLLFLDADTTLTSPNSLARLTHYYAKQGASGLLSLQPYHETEKLYESLSAIFNVIVITGMNVFTYWPDRFQAAGAFGPCILTSKADYFETGGHREIQAAIMDDLALGQAYQAHDLPLYCLGGKGLISFRMYPEGFKQLVEGWTKSFATASQSTAPFVMALVNLWIAGGVVISIALGVSLLIMDTPLLIIAAVLYVLYAGQMALLARRTGRFPLWIFAFFPLLLLFFTAIFLYSLFRTHVLRSVNWRGRKIDV